MPIKIDAHDGTDFPIKPGTNEATALRFLVRHPGYGFSPAELATETEVSNASAGKTLRRLVDKNIIETTGDGYYYVQSEDVDRLRSRLMSLRSLDHLFETFDGDWYSNHPGWADDLPDLGPTPVPEEKLSPDTSSDDTSSDEPATGEYEDLPDLGPTTVPEDTQD